MKRFILDKHTLYYSQVSHTLSLNRLLPIQSDVKSEILFVLFGHPPSQMLSLAVSIGEDGLVCLKTQPIDNRLIWL